MRFLAPIFGIVLLSCAFAAGTPPSPLDANSKLVVLVFLSAECPISNRMAPELERIHQKFATNDLAMWFVYPNRSETEEMIRKHRDEFHLQAPFLRDPEHNLVKLTGAKVTPEAAIFDAKRSLAYCGRVNDQFLALGKARPEPTTHDLEAAIEALLAGHAPAQARTRAVGCYIEEK